MRQEDETLVNREECDVVCEKKKEMNREWAKKGREERIEGKR